MLLILLASLVFLANSHPIVENEANNPLNTTDVPQNIQRAISHISYIQNFKNAMTEYVKSQNPHLTIHEIEQVENIIEEFLINFAKDFRETIENQSQFKNGTATLHEQQIQDGLPDDTFNGIAERIRSDFPEVSEQTANEVVYKLRKNLLETRMKLDVIIRQSRQSQAYYEVDN